MKRIVIILLCLWIFGGYAFAAEISWNRTFQGEPLWDGNRLVIPELDQRLQASGGPDLPMVSRTYRFPANTRLSPLSADKLVTAEKILPTAPSILPPKPTVSGICPATPVYNPLCGGDDYPNRWYDMDIRRGLDPDTLQPIIFVTIKVYPVRVKGRHARFLKEFRLHFQTVMERGNHIPTTTQSLLIVGPRSFLNLIPSFITHKNSMGIMTYTRSLEDIETSGTGRDLAEKIKLAIKEAYDIQGIRYVLLLGDVDVIPVRYVFHAGYGGMNDWQNLPCDLYYADLYDGNGEFCDWDEDGDGVFGEYNNGGLDGSDLMPDVLWGRIPAGDEDELLAAVTKIQHYESTVTGSEAWTHRIVLAGADTFTRESHGDMTGIPEGEATKELIANQYLMEYDLVKLYETDRYSRTAELTTEALANAFEDGALYVNFANHGWIQGWAFDGGFDTGNAHALDNYDTLPVAFGYACSTGVFDTENPESPGQGMSECLAEAFVLDPDGGAVGYYGATRTAFAGGFGTGGHLGAMGFLDWRFFEGIGSGSTVQGRLYLKAVSELILEKGLIDTADVITLMEFEYFGDPSLSAGGAPVLPAFSIVSRGYDDDGGGNGNGCAEPGETITFHLVLVNDGAPATNVHILLSSDDPDITILSGSADIPNMQRGTLADITPPLSIAIDGSSETNRVVQLRLTVQSNETTTVIQHPFYIGSGAYPIPKELWVTSDQNYDNFASPGERIQFAPALENIGCESLENSTASIEIDDVWITDYGLQGSGDIPVIDPWETVIPQRLFYMQIDQMTPNNHVVMCHITVDRQETREQWEYDLPLVIKDLTGPLADFFSVDPPSPAPGQEVTVTVRVRDTSGVTQVSGNLNTYGIEETLSFDMYDDGLHGDGEAGDSIFGARIIIPDLSSYFLVDIVSRDGLGNVAANEAVGGIATIAFESDDPILIVSRGEHDLYLGLFTQALQDAGYGYDVWSWYRGIPSLDILDKYLDGVVIWFFAHSYPFLETQERNAISYILDHQGRLLITEQDIGWAMVEVGSQETQQWYENTLLANYVKDNAGKQIIEGVGGDAVGDGLLFSIRGGSGAQNQDWPSVIDPISPAVSCFHYQDYSGAGTGTAGLRAERNGAKWIYLAFGFEGISSQADRETVMDAALSWLGVPKTGSGCPWDQAPGWWFGPELTSDAIYSSAAYCPVDQRIYRAGGADRSFNTVNPEITYIDTITRRPGKTGVSLETPRFYHAIACMENTAGPGIYIIGGINNLYQIVRSVELYDPRQNTITTLSDDPLPDDINGIPGTYVVCDNKFYWLGTAYQGPPYQNGDTWVFDPMKTPGQRWRKLDTVQVQPRFFCAAAALDGKIYLAGGLSQDSSSSVKVYDTLSVLDTRADTPIWEDISTHMPTPLAFCSGAAIPEGANIPFAGCFLIAGGSPLFGDSTNETYIYNPVSNNWKTWWPTQEARFIRTPLQIVPSPRGSEIWILGGYYQSVYANTEILYPGTDPEGMWIGIRTNQETVPSNATLRLYMDIAGNETADAIDCYLALETYGLWYFITADPVFPTFTETPLPFFSNAPFPENMIYSGLLFDIPIPDGTPEIYGTFYAATVFTGTADLAGGLAWADFTVGGP